MNKSEVAITSLIKVVMLVVNGEVGKHTTFTGTHADNILTVNGKDTFLNDLYTYTHSFIMTRTI